MQHFAAALACDPRCAYDECASETAVAVIGIHARVENERMVAPVPRDIDEADETIRIERAHVHDAAL